MKLPVLRFSHLTAISGIFLVTACDSPAPPSGASSSDSTKKPAAAAPATGSKVAVATPEPKQSTKPRANLLRTKQLYDSLTTQQAGMGPGKVEWRDGSGILMHPGSTPTEAVFDVSGMYGSTDLAFWISGLPKDALGNPKSGTAAVEVFLDGVSQGRKKVDRETNESLAVNLTGVSTMRVVVDDSDGTQLFDWFFMGLK